jgi:hypothetical protein
MNYHYKTWSNLALQNFLRHGGNVTALREKYGIKAIRSTKFPALVLFKYDQIDSPMGERIVQQSRGVILNELDNWGVVARPFDKFFNHGEGHAATIDWLTARVQEKVDGSLMVMYAYQGDWHVATTGHPDAGGQVNGFPFTFAELFWETYHQQFSNGGRKARFPSPADADKCFMFELTTPFNRVVVRHQKPRLTYLGARDVNGKEYAPSEPNMYWYSRVEEFPLRSVEDVIATFKNMSPLSQEGYVIVDGRFNRIKVKHPGYVALHHMKDSWCPRRMLEVIRTGETSEVLEAFPEYRAPFTDIQTKYNALVEELETAYSTLSGISEQKAFALEAQKSKVPSALFAMRRGWQPTIKAHLADIHIDKLMGYLGINAQREAPCPN